MCKYKRKTSYLSSTQSTLSEIKRKLKLIYKERISKEYLDSIRLNKKDTDTLLKQKSLKVHEKGVNVNDVPADALILDCIDLLRNPMATRGQLVIACAALSGRRMVEIITTMEFSDPLEEHENEMYWMSIKGLAKQRGSNRTIDVPCLCKRMMLQDGINRIRRLFPQPTESLNTTDKSKWINNKYGQEIRRSLQKICICIRKLHDFRKFYAAACCHYFNEKNKSRARMASDCLGHKQTSSAVLTYMNLSLSNVGTLQYGLNLV
jgi:hypothetical protein